MHRLSHVAALLACVASLANGQNLRSMLSDQVWVFPFGWRSSQQIAKTRETVQFSAHGSYRVEGNDIVFLAPSEGTLRQVGDTFVFTNGSIRVIYPLLVNAFVTKRGKVDLGEAIVRFTDIQDETFLYAFVDSDEEITSGRFVSGSLDWRTPDSAEICSAISGVLFVTKTSEDDSDSIVTIYGDQYEIFNMGVDKMSPSESGEAKSGELVGMSSANGSWHKASITYSDNLTRKP